MGIPETGSIAIDVAAREAHVLGEGPRIAPRPNEECDQDAFDLVNKVRAGAGAGPTTDMPEYMRIMIKHRALFEPNMILGDALYNGTIPPRERELAILRCGLLCRAPYEWGEHVRIGQRVGLTPDEINRVLDGSSAPGWSELDRAVIRGVEELIADHALSDETWAVFAKHWDEQQLIEFPFMIGQYVAIAYVQNTLRVPLSAYNPGLSSRPNGLWVSRMSEAEADEPRGGDLVRRHRLSTRVWHWLNAATVTVMLMSGLMIFNAHPRLYWGEYGANFDRAWLAIGAIRQEGALRIGDTTFRTTGVLGVFTDADGEQRRYAFPDWATIPSYYSLADARLWHLAFACVLALSLAAYLLWSLANGHLRRGLHVTRRDWRGLGHEVVAHARLRFPTGAAALRYNALQKIAYASVLFGLLPLMIATGLAMSPGMDAAWPWLTQVFGGRQSARSLHFIAAFVLVGFVMIHVAMVLLAGPVNQMRGMITGWYRLPRRRDR